MFLRVAELNRWRFSAVTGFDVLLFKHRWVFLVTENNVKYMKPIPGFQKYSVESVMKPMADDKYFEFEHVFVEHPESVKAGRVPKIYAIVTGKAVIKETTGKTVKPSTVALSIPYFKQIDNQ